MDAEHIRDRTDCSNITVSYRRKDLGGVAISIDGDSIYSALYKFADPKGYESKEDI